MCQKLTLIGLKVKASEKLNNYIEQLNLVSQANLPVYLGTGSGASRWSNSASCNPASAAMYAMQGEISQQKLTNAEIDWPAFERLYTWCNQHGYECNEYITDSMPISELLSSIGSTCRAEILRQNGKITVIQDIVRNGFVQMFTPRNSWGYEETIAKAEIPDAMAIGFVDKTTGYAENELKIYNTPSGNPSAVPDTVQDLKLWGVTSSEQARKIGMYKYAVSRSRAIIHKFSADFEYMLCSKGDWIKYAGDIALAGITQGRIAAVIIENDQITGVSCDEKLELEVDINYAIRIRKSDGTAILKNIYDYEAATNTVYFETPETNTTIHEGDLFTFGTVGNDAIDLIITDIQCGENLTADIIAVEYAPQIFNVDSPDFVLPTFENRITPVRGIIDNGQITNWHTYITYHDSFDRPQTPIGNGSQEGWHYNLTADSKWQSIKTARTITEGVWSAPIQTTSRIETALETGAYPTLVPEKYLGVYTTNTPDYLEGNFFLCGADFSKEVCLLTDKGLLEMESGAVLAVTCVFKKDIIYLARNKIWEPIGNKNDHRYLFATNDLVSLGGTISPNLQTAILKSRGHYKGVLSVDPSTPADGDYYLYNGPTLSTREKGILYLYSDTQGWRKLDPSDASNYCYYMTACTDNLTLNDSNIEPAIFSTLFAKSIVASEALIRVLSAQIINLQTGGIIKGNFNGYAPAGRITEEGTTGFAIDSYGKAVFNDIRIRAGIQSQGFFFKRYQCNFEGQPTSSKLQNILDFIDSHSNQNWPDYLTTQYLSASGNITLAGSEYTVTGKIQYLEIKWEPGDVQMYIRFDGLVTKNGTYKQYSLPEAYLKVGKNTQYGFPVIYFDPEGFMTYENFTREQIDIGEIQRTSILLLA